MSSSEEATNEPNILLKSRKTRVCFNPLFSLSPVKLEHEKRHPSVSSITESFVGPFFAPKAS